jgi:hypothetical protein
MIFKKLFGSSVMKSREEREAELYRALIRREAKIGGEIFGEPTPGSRREFFCLDERTWIWHEEWTDANGQLQIRTTRYDVRPDTILKAQDGQNYQKVNHAEAKRLAEAVKMYGERVNRELYAAYI